MPIRREFLDWKAPALSAAAEFLLAQWGADSPVDLSGVIVAVPGARAGRRLLELLVERSDARGVGLAPPRIVTIGALPELLYRPRRPFADSLSQQLAWVRAIQSLPAEVRPHLLPVPPADDDTPGWLAIGALVAHVHRELAADGLDFPRVVAAASKLDGFDELPRWQTLAAAQRAYLALLDELGLWDLQTARLVAIAQREFSAPGPIVLVGTVDLDGAVRAMLDQVADQVTALILAPPALGGRFDEHGCLVPGAWLSSTIDLADSQIETADSPGDQADAVVRQLAELGEQFATDEVTLGVPDESLVPYLVERLAESGLVGRWGVGTPLVQSAPGKLLAAAAEFVEGRRWPALAALVRHPDVGRWLEGRGSAANWLDALDDYYTERLPARVPARWPPGDRAQSTVAQVVGDVAGLLRPLSGEPRPLGDWRAAVDEVLLALYADRPLDRNRPADRVTLAACRAIQDALDAFGRIDRRLAPSVSGPLALRLALGALSGEAAAPPADRGAIELLGWLELPLDDAPVLIVTGMNEGIVPEAKNSDLFLPNELRRRLGLLDNDRRYARDAYALSALAAARRKLHLICGRRGTDRDPLIPSRLLLACPIEHLAERTQQLFDRPPPRPRPLGARATGTRRRSGFTVPPAPQEPVELPSIRVTEFRDYLACPYRYWLAHRLKLEPRCDEGEELDGGPFGDLLHEVLKQFGHSDAKDSTDDEAIAARLCDLLDREAARRFGDVAQPAVWVQVEQARQRLAAFAHWQARWRAAGWQIQCVEQDLAELDVRLAVGDDSILLRGRIDRIDRHERTGEQVIFDYKAGDGGDSPEDVHRNGGEWIDLQLPLYRLAAQALKLQQPVRLGYILLPKDVTQVIEVLAEWTTDDLKDADRVAAAVVIAIRGGKFWPPADSPPAFGAPLAAICQDDQFRAAATAAGEEGES